MRLLLIVVVGALVWAVAFGDMIVLLRGEGVEEFLEDLREGLRGVLGGVSLRTESDYEEEKETLLKYAKDAESGIIRLGEYEISDPDVPEFIAKMRTEWWELKSVEFIPIKPNIRFHISLRGNFPTALKYKAMWLEFAFRIYYRISEVHGKTAVFYLPSIYKGDEKFKKWIYKYMFWELAIYRGSFKRVAVFSGKKLDFKSEGEKVRVELNLSNVRGVEGEKFLYIRPLFYNPETSSYTEFPESLSPYIAFLVGKRGECSAYRTDYYIYGGECKPIDPSRSFVLTKYAPENRPPILHIQDEVAMENPLRENLSRYLESRIEDPDGDEVDKTMELVGYGPVPDRISPGKYRLKVEVDDGKGGRVEKTVDLIVVNTPPKVNVLLRGGKVLPKDWRETSVYVEVEDPDPQRVEVSFEVLRGKEVVYEDDWYFEVKSEKTIRVKLPGVGKYRIVVKADDDVKEISKTVVFRVNEPPLVKKCDVYRDFADSVRIWCEAGDEDGYVKEIRYEIQGKHGGEFVTIDVGSVKGPFLDERVPAEYGEYRVKLIPIDDFDESGEEYETILRLMRLSPPVIVKPKNGDRVDPNSVILAWEDKNAVSVVYDVSILDISGEERLMLRNIKEKEVEVKGLRGGREYRIEVIARLGSEMARSSPVSIRTVRRPLTFYREIKGLKGENWRLIEFKGRFYAYDPDSGRAVDLVEASIRSKEYAVKVSGFYTLPKYLKMLTEEFAVVKDPDLEGEILRKGEEEVYFEGGICDLAVGRETVAVLDCEDRVHILKRENLEEICAFYLEYPDRIIWYNGRYYVDDGEYVLSLRENGRVLQKYSGFYDDVEYFFVGKRVDLIGVDDSGVAYIYRGSLEKLYPRVGSAVKILTDDRGRVLIASKPYFLYLLPDYQEEERRMDYTRVRGNIIDAFEICDKHYAVVTDRGIEVRSVENLNLEYTLDINGISEVIFAEHYAFALRELRGEREVVVMNVECH